MFITAMLKVSRFIYLQLNSKQDPSSRNQQKNCLSAVSKLCKSDVLIEEENLIFFFKTQGYVDRRVCTFSLTLQAFCSTYQVDFKEIQPICFVYMSNGRSLWDALLYLIE